MEKVGIKAEKDGKHHNTHLVNFLLHLGVSTYTVMVTTWKTPEQTYFLQGFILAYVRSGEENRKEFWVEVLEAWFQCFPIGTLPTDVINKAGSEDKALDQAKVKKVRVSEAWDDLY